SDKKAGLLRSTPRQAKHHAFRLTRKVHRENGARFLAQAPLRGKSYSGKSRQFWPRNAAPSCLTCPAPISSFLMSSNASRETDCERMAVSALARAVRSLPSHTAPIEYPPTARASVLSEGAWAKTGRCACT